jgi:hypothetical protein
MFKTFSTTNATSPYSKLNPGHDLHSSLNTYSLVVTDFTPEQAKSGQMYKGKLKSNAHMLVKHKITLRSTPHGM